MFAGPRAAFYDLAHRNGQTFPGVVDGKPRFRIEDRRCQPAGLLHGFLNAHNSSQDAPPSLCGELGGLLDHPELYDNYPELYGIIVNLVSAPAGAKGQNSVRGTTSLRPLKRGIQCTITLYLPAYCGEIEVLSSLLHETQHVVQMIEGHPPGGSAARILDLSIQQRAAALSRITNKNPDAMKTEAASLAWIASEEARGSTRKSGLEKYLGPEPKNCQMYRNRMKRLAVKRYLATPGEIEARLTEEEFVTPAGMPLPEWPPPELMKWANPLRKIGYRSSKLPVTRIPAGLLQTLRDHGYALRCRDNEEAGRPTPPKPCNIPP